MPVGAHDDAQEAELGAAEDHPRAVIGLTLGIGNIGVVAGALASNRITRRLRIGRTIVLSMFVCGLGGLLFPLATRTTSVVWLATGSFLFAFGSPIYNINQVSLRQAITPQLLQGRMNTRPRCASSSGAPCPWASLIGGVFWTAPRVAAHAL